MTQPPRRAEQRASAAGRGAPSPAVRRRTRLLGLVGGTSVGVLFAAELLRVWRLGTLPLTRGGEEVNPRSLRSARRVLREGYRVSSTRENTLVNMIGSFVFSFGSARVVTHAIRVRGHLGPIRDLKTSGGRHIHHFLPGLVLAMLAGGWSVASQRQEVDRWLAVPFGLGTGLVLDEAALLLELEDVYWSEEGLVSVQLAFAALGLLAALAYLSSVSRRRQPGSEADWETAAQAFDQLQELPGATAQRARRRRRSRP